MKWQTKVKCRTRNATDCIYTCMWAFKINISVLGKILPVEANWVNIAIQLELMPNRTVTIVVVSCLQLPQQPHVEDFVYLSIKNNEFATEKDRCATKKKRSEIKRQ